TSADSPQPSPARDSKNSSLAPINRCTPVALCVRLALRVVFTRSVAPPSDPLASRALRESNSPTPPPLSKDPRPPRTSLRPSLARHTKEFSNIALPIEPPKLLRPLRTALTPAPGSGSAPEPGLAGLPAPSESRFPGFVAPLRTTRVQTIP